MSRSSNKPVLIDRCPWCGSSGSIVKNPLWNGSHGYHGCYEIFVQCVNQTCRAIAPNGKTDTVYRTENDAVNIAIDRWNTRNTNGA